MTDTPQGYTPRCYDNFLIVDFVKHKDKNGVTHRVASFTNCCRKYLYHKPGHDVTPIESMRYQVRECSRCCPELSKFGASFTMLIGSKKPEYVAKITEFWKAMCRLQSRTFEYTPDWKEKVDEKQMLPMPGVPTFYNPDKFIEDKHKIDEMIF